MASESRAFVAGATGYVGRAVVAELRKRGVETIAHVRPDSARLSSWTQQFTAIGATVDSTPWDDVSMVARISELAPTIVFALLGTTKARARSAAEAGAAPADYEAVDYALSVLLIKAAAAAPSRPKVVYLSAAGVSERARGAYLDVRVRVERELRDAGVHYVIARPAFVTGADREENRPVERWSARLGDAVLSVAGLLGGRQMQARWSSVTGTELAQALVRLGLDAQATDAVVHADGLRGQRA